MYVRSAMITKSSVLSVLPTAWNISLCVVLKNYYSTISHNACLRTVMDALTLLLRIEF